MSALYVDTSALAKLISPEPESAAFVTALTGVDALTSEIAVTELHRLALRLDIDVTHADAVLEAVSLVRVSRRLLRRAGALAPAALRSLDAIHLQTAIETGVERFACYDRRLGEAAVAVGLEVVAPHPGA